MLSHVPELEITEDLFRVLASTGQYYDIKELSENRGLEQPPIKWIQIAELYNAAKDGDIDALKSLLERGVAPDIPNPRGRTPVCAAVKNKHNAAVELLIAHGANINQLWDDWTPLTYCAEKLPSENYDAMVKVLVEAGASLTFKDGEGMTPEEEAKVNGNINLFMYFKNCRKAQEKAGQGNGKGKSKKEFLLSLP